MSNPFERLPSYSPVPSDPSHLMSDTSSTSNIPISDFRRNEARPIITDNGTFVFFSYLFSNKHVIFYRTT